MKIGFLGCGKMGGALLDGWLEAGVVGGGDVHIYDPALSETRFAGAQMAGTAQEMVAASDVVVLAVKPQRLDVALAGLTFSPGQVVVSVLAGTSVATIAPRVGPAHLVRVMSNILVELGSGSTVVLAHADAEVTRGVVALFGPVGHVEVVHDEGLLHAATALVGSAPAALFVAVEALADGAVACGMPRQAALGLAASVVRGSGALALHALQTSEPRRHPAELKDAVASPGGTTIQALAALEARGFRAALFEAIVAAARRSEEIQGS